MQIGRPFTIFQDRKDIRWGQNWRERIENSLDAVSFLIPIITPCFFNSKACRSELERFLQRENDLGRNDLVLPIYYVDTPLVNDERARATDELAQIIATRQYADWRDLRLEPFTSPEVVKTLAQLGTQLRDALEDRQGAQTVSNEPSDRETEASTLSTEVDDGLNNPAAGPTDKSEPPTRVVDPMHRADHSDIAEAVSAANPGDRILVRPGLYQSGLVIDKPLEIIGEGPLEEIVVETSEATTVLFQTTMGRLSNLTIRQTGDGEWYGVDIAQGRLELNGCDVSSESLACIAIHSGADPRVRNNRIHDGKRGGVSIYGNARGTLEDNEVFANAYSGVEIRDGADPMLRHNRIHHNGNHGVYFNKRGLGTLEANEIIANGQAGVMSTAFGTNPSLRRNRITDNSYEGVWVTNKAGGTFEDNDLRNNTRGPWDVSADSEPKIKRRNNQE